MESNNQPDPDIATPIDVVQSDLVAPADPAEPLPVLPVLNYDDGRQLKSLVVSEPAPGELLITESDLPWSRCAAAYGGVVVGLMTIFISLVMLSPNNWGRVLGAVCIGLVITILCWKTFRSLREPQYVHITDAEVIVYGIDFLGCSREVWKREKIRDVIPNKHMGIVSPSGSLKIRTNHLTKTIFQGRSWEDIQTVTKIIRGHLGMGEYMPPWYNRPII